MSFNMQFIGYYFYTILRSDIGQRKYHLRRMAYSIKCVRPKYYSVKYNRISSSPAVWESRNVKIVLCFILKCPGFVFPFQSFIKADQSKLYIILISKLRIIQIELIEISNDWSHILWRNLKGPQSIYTQTHWIRLNTVFGSSLLYDGSFSYAPLAMGKRLREGVFLGMCECLVYFCGLVVWMATIIQFGLRESANESMSLAHTLMWWLAHWRA